MILLPSLPVLDAYLAIYPAVYSLHFIPSYFISASMRFFWFVSFMSIFLVFSRPSFSPICRFLVCLSVFFFSDGGFFFLGVVENFRFRHVVSGRFCVFYFLLPLFGFCFFHFHRALKTFPSKASVCMFSFFCWVKIRAKKLAKIREEAHEKKYFHLVRGQRFFN